MKKSLLFIAIIGLLWSCSSVLDEKYTQNPSDEVVEQIKEKLTPDEMEIFAESVVRLHFSDENLQEMTYGEILEKGKEWEAEQEKIKIEEEEEEEKAIQEETERIEKLSKFVKVNCSEKYFEEYEGEYYLTYILDIQNNSDQAIKAFKGDVVFTDLYDEVLTILELEYEDGVINSGEEVIYEFSTGYDEYDDDDVKIGNKELENLKVSWEPSAIIFKDGSIIE